MELELKKGNIHICEIGGEIALTQEETAETIVPDYCPDIARIIETNGCVFLHSREIRDGKAEISGTIRVSVLYTPDGDSGIRVMEFAMPFSAETDQLTKYQRIRADTVIESLETRILNPRKVFTHCKLVSNLTGYRQTVLQIAEDVDAPCSIEKRCERQHTVLLSQIAEKDFTFTGEIRLSPGRDGAAELLNSQVHGIVTENKIVGNKLIIKGVFHAELLYRTTQGACGWTSVDLPYSQIMEIDGISEKAIAQVCLQLTGSDMQLDSEDDDGRTIRATLFFRADVCFRESQELSLLSDLYSTAYETSYEAVPVALTCFHETLTRRQNIREVLEIGVVADAILMVSASCGAVQISRDGNTATLRTGITVRALYLDEGGTVLVAERCVDTRCQLEVSASCRISAYAVCPETVQASLGERGIEVRFPVDFCMEAEELVKKVTITEAVLKEDAPKDRPEMPSLVLRCLGKQESVWDLAKSHNTTIAAILAANQLDEDAEFPTDKLLLIPRIRA